MIWIGNACTITKITKYKPEKTKLQKADDQGIKVLKRLELDHIGTTSNTNWQIIDNPSWKKGRASIKLN